MNVKARIKERRINLNDGVWGFCSAYELKERIIELIGPEGWIENDLYRCWNRISALLQVADDVTPGSISDIWEVAFHEYRIYRDYEEEQELLKYYDELEKQAQKEEQEREELYRQADLVLRG